MNRIMYDPWWRTEYHKSDSRNNKLQDINITQIKSKTNTLKHNYEE